MQHRDDRLPYTAQSRCSLLPAAWYARHSYLHHMRPSPLLLGALQSARGFRRVHVGRPWQPTQYFEKPCDRAIVAASSTRQAAGRPNMRSKICRCEILHVGRDAPCPHSACPPHSAWICKARSHGSWSAVVRRTRCKGSPWRMATAVLPF